MITRRSFIRSGSALTAGIFVAPALNNFKKSSYIGLQLYTVRDAMQQDPAGTLHKVAQIGYKCPALGSAGHLNNYSLINFSVVVFVPSLIFT